MQIAENKLCILYSSYPLLNVNLSNQLFYQYFHSEISSDFVSTSFDLVKSN